MRSQAWQTNSAKILATAGDHVLVIVKIRNPLEARVVRISDDRNHSWRQIWHGGGKSTYEEVWRTEISIGDWLEIWVTLDQRADAELSVSRVIRAYRGTAMSELNWRIGSGFNWCSLFRERL